MRNALLALLLSTCPAAADISRVTLACDAVTAATGCLKATQLWGFEPSGGMVDLPAPGPILLALSLPGWEILWRAVIAEAKDRPAVYRWTGEGALVTVQPHPALDGVNTLVVYQPPS
jgi:hypothetical protein